MEDVYKETLPAQILEMNNKALDIIVSFSDFNMNGEKKGHKTKDEYVLYIFMNKRRPFCTT